MIDFDLHIKSDLVILRPIQLSDLDEMHTRCLDKEMWYYFTSDLSNKTELQEWINDAILAREKKIRVAFTVLDANTMQIIGSTSLGSISERDKRIEIGWTWLTKNYHGKGFNRAVKLLLLNYCFEECAMQRVEIKTDVLNMPARKAVEKIGFVEEGVLRSHTQMINNRRRDTIYYGLLKTEWESIKLSN